MVRSISRGQFHVTSAWDGYAALGGSETEEVIVPSAMEEEPDLTDLLDDAPREPEPRESPEPDPRPSFCYEPPGPGLEPVRPDPPDRLDTPLLGPPASAAVFVASRDPVPPVHVAPPSAVIAPGPADGSRTLVGLLARMWLLRTTTGANGGTAIAGPGLLAIDSTAAPVPPPPAAPPAPPTPSASLEAGPRAERSTLLAPDLDDRRPLGGLATFLVELAEVSHPTTPVVAPTNGGLRPRVVVRLLHCGSHVPERLVSRDSCRQPRVGR
jgi:hypothetical protein